MLPFFAWKIFSISFFISLDFYLQVLFRYYGQYKRVLRLHHNKKGVGLVRRIDGDILCGGIDRSAAGIKQKSHFPVLVGRLAVRIKSSVAVAVNKDMMSLYGLSPTGEPIGHLHPVLTACHGCLGRTVHQLEMKRLRADRVKRPHAQQKQNDDAENDQLAIKPLPPRRTRLGRNGFFGHIMPPPPA